MSQPLPECKIKTLDIRAALERHGLLLKAQNTDKLESRLTSFSPDSRKAGPNCGFIAYKGVASDGHRFIPQAEAAGAAFIISEQDVFSANNAPTFVVRSGRAAWSVLAAAASGNPQDKLTMLGVTGTNGKTSTAWMTRQLLKQAGVQCVMIGTLGAWIGDEFLETKHTSPDPDFFYPVLQHAVEAGIKTCIMEVSSHAIAQEKLTPVRYDAAAFTSFSRDHLDFHKDENDYFDTKCRLFDRMTKLGGTKIFCSRLSKLPNSAGGADTVIYSLKGAPNPWMRYGRLFQITVEQESLAGSAISLHSTKGDIPYFGAHAIENFAAALLLAEQVTDKVRTSSSWKNLAQVPGRLEKVTGKKDISVFVDYAHTPDALEKTLTFLDGYKKSRLLVVFGCGGDRDPGKRPQMGAIATRIADATYITSDNPRTEDPETILQQIIGGCDQTRPIKAIADRRTAISSAIQDAQPSDIILIAGKGHEPYQIIGDKVLPFDDRDVAREYLNSL